MSGAAGVSGLVPVAPARERGLKWQFVPRRTLRQACRSREGAWIEIRQKHYTINLKTSVAPARERGLKYRKQTHFHGALRCRSREGAWIEMPKL